MSNSKVHKRLEELKAKHDFHPMNEVKIVVFLEKLVKIGLLPKEELIDEVVLILKNLLYAGKYPTLNPCIDELYDHDKHDLDLSLKKFLKEKITFIKSELDKNTNHVKVQFLIDILFGNLDPFIESEELVIDHIEIQTPFYKLTIEG